MINAFYKIWKILPDRQKKFAVWLALVMLINALMSSIMVASIIPFLTVLSSPESISDVYILQKIFDFFNFESSFEFLMVIGMSCFAIITIASAVQMAKSWAISHFSMQCVHSLSSQLVDNYLGMPYEYFTRHHSSEMGPKVLDEAEQVVFRVVRPITELAAAAFTAATIALLIVFINPGIALISIAAISTIYLSIYIATRKHLANLGSKLLANNRRKFRDTNEIFQGIKYIKSYSLEGQYSESYHAASYSYSNTHTKIDVVSNVPQIALQAVALGGIILLCVIILEPEPFHTGETLPTIIPTLGLFGFAGLRLMPEFTKIFHSSAVIKTGLAAVDSIYADIEETLQQPISLDQETETVSLRTELVLNRVHYSYPDNERSGVHDVSLAISAGSRIGVVGPTGAGKTTLVDIMLGLLSPKSGTVTVDGTQIDHNTIDSWIASVGYVPQDVFLTDASIAKNIALTNQRNEIDVSRLNQAVNQARLEEFVKSLPSGIDTEVGERGVRLSGGQKQRIGIARALYHRANLIVFDEATSALDNITELEILQSIRELGNRVTVITIAHRLSSVANCDKIIVLDEGRVVGFDTWERLVANVSTFTRLVEAEKPDNQSTR